MKYVSKERLMQIADGLEPRLSTFLTGLVLCECKELPDQQWQTIEDFKVNPVDGLCWINHNEEGVVESTYINGLFFYDGDAMLYRDITHVMPIKTPEAPK